MDRLSFVGLALVTFAGIALSRTGGTTTATAQAIGHSAAVPASSSSALQVLRDEMFSLETDRLSGKLNDRQYAELKSAYDIILRRAMERNAKA